MEQHRNNTIRVSIGIQARSGSTRLPMKAFALIDGKPMLKHVIDACTRSAMYLNKYGSRGGLNVSTTVLTPFGDPIVDRFKNKVAIIEGSDADVLSRYVKLMEAEDSDYIVRVTGDCPLIPHYLITKHIKVAFMNGYDYTSNVHESIRTVADGFDCEVISRDLLTWADKNATDPLDREHVTTLIRRCPPEGSRFGDVVGFINTFGKKLSVDTQEDLDLVREEYKILKDAVQKSEELHGRENCHRF